MVNVTLLQWKGSFIVSFNLYVGFFFGLYSPGKKKIYANLLSVAER